MKELKQKAESLTVTFSSLLNKGNVNMKTDSDADEPHKPKQNGSPSKLWQIFMWKLSVKKHNKHTGMFYSYTLALYRNY